MFMVQGWFGVPFCGSWLDNSLGGLVNKHYMGPLRCVLESLRTNASMLNSLVDCIAQATQLTSKTLRPKPSALNRLRIEGIKTQWMPV